MRGWRVERNGEPSEVMQPRSSCPIPEPGPGAVALAVRACGLSYPDLLLIQGKHQQKADLPMTPGVELVRHRPALGDDVDRLSRSAIGSSGWPQLPARRPGRGRARRHGRPAAAGRRHRRCRRGAAMYTAFQTAWFALHHRAAPAGGRDLARARRRRRGRLGRDPARRAAGARVIATAGSPEKVALCRELGADEVIDYVADPDFAPIVNELTGGRGADVIFDPVGGDVFDRSRRCIAWEGRLLVIGFASEVIPTVKMNHLLIKNYSVLGLYWGPYRDRDPALIRRAHDEVVAVDPRRHRPSTGDGDLPARRRRRRAAITRRTRRRTDGWW